jgi:hypothetical protein
VPHNTVKQGDCITSIAFKDGLFPDTIWNDSKNTKLKQDRKNPNVLVRGDVVYEWKKEESCKSEQRHSFKRKGVPEKLIIQFNINGEPRTNKAYFLDVDGELSEEETDVDGKVSFSILPDARIGRIFFRESGDAYKLNPGHLYPITEISGVQRRFRNLDFYSGLKDGEMSQALEQAIIRKNCA